MKHALISLTLGLALALGLLVLLPPVAFTSSIATVQAADSVIFVNQNVTGTVHNGESWETAYKFLEDALQHAEATDQIWVATGIYTPTNEISSTATFQLVEGVAIYGGFTGVAEEDSLDDRNYENNPTILSGDLEGNDITEGGIVTNTDNISGTNAYHIVTGSGMTAAAIIDGFIVTAGNANGTDDNSRGGGMLNKEGSPTLRNITFSGNYATFGGGMDNSESSNPVLEYVTFTYNTSGDDGGGLHNDNSNPTLSKVTFEYNNAVEGGGIHNWQSNPSLVEVTFNANQANDHGGGMYNFESSPTLTNVTFRSNQANLGSGMYNRQSNQPMLTNVTFSDNKANQNGGGMYSYSSSPILTNVLFSGNSAEVNGGGILNDVGSNPTLTNVTFSGNFAKEDGGGMYNSNGVNVNPTLTNVTFSGNSAEGDGGGMYNSNGSNPTLINCILWDNLALENDEISGIEHATITYSNIRGISNVNGNISERPFFVAPIDASYAPTTTGDYHLKVDSPGIDIGNNNAPGLRGITTDLDGNKRFVDGNRNGDPIVDMGAYEFFSPIYVDETAEGPEHNGLSWTRAYTNIQDALNIAEPGDEIWVAEGVYYPDEGEGQTNNDPTSTFQLIEDVALYGGFAGDEESLDERNWEDGNLTILSGDLEGNDITEGGIVTNTDNIIGSNAYHVITSDYYSEDAILDGFAITAGYANNDGDHENGGGMYNEDSTITMTHITFCGNYAKNLGGGMYNDKESNPILNDITFSHNQANNGGGMYNSFNSIPSLTDIIFSHNQANSGGGMYNHTDVSTMTLVTFSHNQANNSGGGMYNYTDSSPTLINAIFSDNQANENGGGIYNYTDSDPTIINTVFTNNAAGANGGGIYNYNSNPILLNITISGNQADENGGGIYNNNSNLTLINSILWDNLANGIGPEIHNTEGSQPNISYSDIEGSTPTGSNINQDPHFVDSANGNYHLNTISPVIDKGSNTSLINSIPFSITTDLDNKPRFVDGDDQNGPEVDMGAYEFQTTVELWTVYLPLLIR